MPSPYLSSCSSSNNAAAPLTATLLSLRTAVNSTSLKHLNCPYYNAQKSSTHRRFIDNQVAPGGVDRRPDTQREGRIKRNMAKRQAGKDRHSQRTQPFCENVIQSLTILTRALRFRIITTGVGPNCNAHDLLQKPAIEQMGEHPIEPIGRFFHVLQKQDLAAKGDLIGRADGCADQGKVSA